MTHELTGSQVCEGVNVVRKERRHDPRKGMPKSSLVGQRMEDRGTERKPV